MIVVDEAHKMSGHVTSAARPKYTKRYHLGRGSYSDHCRHFLLLSATPHNGKQDDFELFLMALLDEDRFEGQTDGATPCRSNTTDLMRRHR